MISKERLMGRLVELKKSLEEAKQQVVIWTKNVDGHLGAIQQCEQFLKEIEKASESLEPKEE